MMRVLPLLAKKCVLFPVLSIGWVAGFIYLIRGGPARYASWPWWRILLDVVLLYVVGIAILWWIPEMVQAAAKRRLAAKDETHAK
ncbi:hypothetical protein H5T53_05475 [Candidatus Bipolaricaulota bacterium]|nr:hypothetical protein [Candidatus Bipolaricaulota bacterium]